MSYFLFGWMQHLQRFRSRHDAYREEGRQETPPGFVEGPEGVLMKKEEYERVFGERK
jgi:hypothetical protein